MALTALAGYEDYARLRESLLGAEGVAPVIDALSERDRKQAALAARYFADMRLVLRNMRRSLTTGGRATIVVADSRLRTLDIPTSDLIVSLATEAGLRMVGRSSDKIQNRWIPPQRWKHDSVMDFEHILKFARD